MARTSKPLETQPTELNLDSYLEAIALGDHDAFAAIFNFYAPRINGYFIRRGVERGTAQDLTQEALIKIWRYSGSFSRERGTPSSWIFAIARNTYIDACRAHRDAIAPLGDMQVQPTPVDDCLESEKRQVVTNALRSLPASDLTLLKASFYDDISHGGIVKELGLPLGTIKSRVRRALQKLRDKLESYHDA